VEKKGFKGVVGAVERKMGRGKLWKRRVSKELLAQWKGRWVRTELKDDCAGAS
jgi:hypothetical protein